EPGLSAALDGFPRWYRLSGYGPGRLTSRDRRRGPLHPRLESTSTVRTTPDVDCHGHGGFHPRRDGDNRRQASPLRLRRAAGGLRPARQAESLLETSRGGTDEHRSRYPVERAGRGGAHRPAGITGQDPAEPAPADQCPDPGDDRGHPPDVAQLRPG